MGGRVLQRRQVAGAAKWHVGKIRPKRGTRTRGLPADSLSHRFSWMKGSTRRSFSNNKKNVCGVHTRRQSAEECSTVFELIDALISWPFIPPFPVPRVPVSSPVPRGDRVAALFPSGARTRRPMEYFLAIASLGSRRTTLRYIYIHICIYRGRILRRYILLSPFVPVSVTSADNRCE